MTLEDAALGKAMREMAEAADLPASGNGWVFTISTFGGSWHITARHGTWQRPLVDDPEDPGPTFLYGNGPTLAEAVRDAREKMTKEVPA